MSGIDRLISAALSTEIKKKLGIDMLKKVERELFLEYGMSIKLSIEHFQIFTNVLKKKINVDVKKFEKDCINKIIKIKKRDDKYIVTIVDTGLLDLILKLFSELDTRKIISSLLENEYTIPQVLKESRIPKTSGYRKIENLIINGLVIESRKVLSGSKKISKIRCLFQEIKIEMKKGKITVKGVVSKKIFEKSTSMKSILEELA